MSKPKIVFAPGCFDNFEGTQEELAQMLADLHQMAEDGTLMDNAEPLDPEEEERFIQAMMKKVPLQ
jgi:hypothetical protein